MSIKIMSQVWQEGPERQADRFVLLALADYANDAGECYPSVRAVAEKTCMSVRGVQQILRRLEVDGWLKTDPQSARNGCNLYTVTPRTTCTPAPRAPRTTCTTPPHVDDIPPAPRAPEPSRTINEPSEDPPSPPRGGDTQGSGFAEFWEIVPKQVAKGAAERAYRRAIKVTDAATIFAAMKAYAESRAGQDDQFTAHPSAWLKARRWEDAANPTAAQDADHEFQSALAEIDRLERDRIERNRTQRGGLRVVAGMDGGKSGL